MADRVHPAREADDHPAAAPGSPPKQPPLPSTVPEEGKPQPTPGTYVIQVPKEHIYRVPSPETAQRFEEYTRRRRRRGSCCCCCLLWIGGVFLTLAFALAVAAGVLYLVFRPKIPSYTVEGLSVKGFNLTSSHVSSPEFDVTVRAENPNGRIGIYYRGGSSAAISYSGVNLCSGTWPVFYQGPRNTTVLTTALRGSGIRLSGAMRGAMAAAQGRGEVPLDVRVGVPVRVRFGAVTTWTVTVEVRCEVAVDKLAAGSRVVRKTCRGKVKI